MIGLVFRFAAIALALSACVSEPAGRDAIAPVADATGAAPRPGLTESAPDTCRLAKLATLKGQPAGNLRTVRLAGPSRIIAPGSIVDQADYIPQRINAYIDASGIITRLDCG